MANPSKRKGTGWESAKVDWWQAQGFADAHRIALHGAADCGDVFVTKTQRGDVIEECKNTKRLAVPEWLRQSENERDNAGAWLCLLSWKLVGIGMADPGRHPVTVRADDAAKVLSYIAELEAKATRLEAENAQLKERRYYV
jgi:hypothetical protein